MVRYSRAMRGVCLTQPNVEGRKMFIVIHNTGDNEYVYGTFDTHDSASHWITYLTSGDSRVVDLIEPKFNAD